MNTAAKDDKNEKDEVALVAGGANFLGAALCRALLEQGFKVICLDNLSHSSRDNIEELLQNPRFSFLQEDFASPSFQPPASLKPKYVFHLASIAAHTVDDKPSLNTLLINSVGTKNLLDIAKEKNAKFIYLSSPEVFQAATAQTSLNSLFAKDVQTENLAFAEGKRFGEILIAEYYKKFDLDTTLVRIKDPYGPAMSLDNQSIMNSLLSQALEKGKIEILGDGLRTANPTFSSDIVEGLLKTAFSSSKGEIFQIINPDRYTEKAIAQHLKLILGNIEIIQKKKTPIVDAGLPLILEETQEKLGWSPKVSLEEGLNQTVAYFKQEKNKEEKKVEKPLPVSPMAKTKINKMDLIRLSIISFLIAVFIWSFVFPLASFFLNTSSGIQNLKQASTKILKNSEVDQALSSAKKAESSFANSQTAVRNAAWIRVFPWFSKGLSSTESYLFLAESLSKAVKYTAAGLEKINHASLPSTNNSETKTDLEQAEKDFEQASFLLETYSTVKINSNDLPANLKGEVEKLNQQKESLKGILEKKQTEIEKLL